MTDAKQATQTHPFKAPTEAMKDMNETLKGMTEAGRKAFIAYVEAGSEIGAHVDKLNRMQLGHITEATRQTTEVLTTIAEASFKAGEKARKAMVEAVELATAGK